MLCPIVDQPSFQPQLNPVYSIPQDQHKPGMSPDILMLFLVRICQAPRYSNIVWQFFSLPIPHKNEALWSATGMEFPLTGKDALQNGFFSRGP